MNYFTDDFIHKQKFHFLKSLNRAQANIGTPLNPAWVEGEIVKSEVDQDGIAVFQVTFEELLSMPATVCQVRLFDTDGEVASIVDKNVLTARGQGMYETLKINLIQSETEVI